MQKYIPLICPLKIIYCPSALALVKELTQIQLLVMNHREVSLLKLIHINETLTYPYFYHNDSGCWLTGWKTNSYSEWENQQLSIGYSRVREKITFDMLESENIYGRHRIQYHTVSAVATSPSQQSLSTGCGKQLLICEAAAVKSTLVALSSTGC